MIIRTYPETNSAKVLLEVPARGRTIVLTDEIFATVHCGDVTSVDHIGVSRWCDVFDEAEAQRLLDWAREQIARQVVS